MLRKKLKLSHDEERNESEHNEDQSDSLSNGDSAYSIPSNHSIYFPSSVSSAATSIPEQMLDVQRKLNNELEKIDFLRQPISYIYNPTVYAIQAMEHYLNLYCENKKKILFIGMNPGPWGMSQTGIPFGDVNMVKNWLKIRGSIGKPSIECPHRKIEGFDCNSKEVSGDRFWNFFKNLCITPNNFFENCFVYNYCPLAFMTENGKNVTPADFEKKELLEELQKACNKALHEVIEILHPEIIIGIGRYAEKQALNVVKLSTKDIQVLYLPHPSPRSLHNNNWPEKAEKFLIDNNLMRYFIKEQINNGTCTEENTIN